MRAYDGAETEYRTESGGFKKYFKDYGIFFIVSAVIFVAAFLCKTFVFSFENGLPSEDVFRHGGGFFDGHLANDLELDELLFRGEEFDNEIVKKVPINLFILGIDEFAALMPLLNDTRDINVEGAVMSAMIISLIAPMYVRAICVKKNKKRERKSTRFYEKATEFVSVYLLESAVLYFTTVGIFFVIRYISNLDWAVVLIALKMIIFIMVLFMFLPTLLSFINVFFSILMFPYVVTISNAINEVMEKAGTEDPTRGIILSVIAVTMVLLLVFIREKLNDLIFKLFLKLNELFGKLFGKIKGLFRRKT